METCSSRPGIARPSVRSRASPTCPTTAWSSRSSGTRGAAELEHGLARGRQLDLRLRPGTDDADQPVSERVLPQRVPRTVGLPHLDGFRIGAGIARDPRDQLEDLRIVHPLRIARTRAFHDPLGASTSTTSPTPAPMSARPSGASGETPPTAEISTSSFSPSPSSTWTIEPTPTCSSVSCSTVTAWWSRSLRIWIRRSSRPCSFLAEWYSKFSAMSPNSRARAIASMISRRRGPSSSASSASSAVRWSGVSCSFRCSFITPRLTTLAVHGRSALITLSRERPAGERRVRRGDRPRALRGGRRACRRREGGEAPYRRGGRHLRLLPVRLRYRANHGQGRAGASLGDDRAEGLPARLRVDREPLRRPARQLHRLRPRGVGARRDPGAGDLRRAAVGLTGGEGVVHLLPEPRGSRRPRRGPHLRLPR